MRFIWITVLITLATTLSAHEYPAGTLIIHHPWAHALPSNANTSAVYMKIENTGDTADQLISASSSIAQAAELHEHTQHNGMLRMQQVPNLSIAPKETLTLAPHGYHIMLIGLKESLVAGQKPPLTLVFAQAGTVDVQIAIEDSDTKESSVQHMH